MHRKAAVRWAGNYSHVQTYWIHWLYCPVAICRKSAEGLKFLLPRNFGKRNAETWPEGVMHLSLQGCSEETWLASTQCSRLGKGGDVLIDTSSESLILVTEEIARLLPGEWRRSCLSVGCDSPAKETARMEEFYFFLFLFILNFGCTYRQIVGEEKA